MKSVFHIIEEVEAIYQWVDEQVAQMERSCKACGNCCDFEAFGHRLYVMTPELLHFKHFVGPEIKEMAGGACPYRIDGKCSVYRRRFSGCRIFACGGDSEKESQLSEEAISRLKAICEAHKIGYRYVYLKEGLKILKNSDIAGFPPPPSRG